MHTVLASLVPHQAGDRGETASVAARSCAWGGSVDGDLLTPIEVETFTETSGLDPLPEVSCSVPDVLAQVLSPSQPVSRARAQQRGYY